ncbi:olfactory receptor 5B17-like [Pygocentrus nattereri]|uniref:olfactory receptor 5B17-like n=1 Tax=Pygocentrus nattereri TaxID=42514 RepID=UPI00189167F6|nr:olfactory receptor 5B17-like [Pygocentrus nattereri]
MENLTFNSPFIQIEGLVVSEQYIYPTFLFFLIIYVLITVSNIGIILLITMERSLHEPMYILFCNLPFNDVFGNSVVIPRIMVDILRPSSERYISYGECAAQAFCYHVHATAAHTILMAMAFDRYVAICNPLHYTTIMTTKMVAKLTASVWCIAVVFVGILLGLTIRLNRCGTQIANPFCDNASLFKVSCENPYITNVFGLACTTILLVSSVGSIVLTYSKIAAVCFISKNKTLNNKFLKTCSTHLTVYLIMWLSSCIMIMLHRFSGYTDYRKGAALLFHIGPGILNPIIYALQCTEIRHTMLKILHSKKVLSSY